MRSHPAKMTDADLAAIIDQQINDSVTYNGELADLREKALQYYEAEESLGGDVPVQRNRSRIVSHDMSDVHGWIMPSLLRVFLGGERVVEYEPRRKGKEDAASQVTDYVNYVFRDECSGYAVLRDALWDGLTLGNGIIKHWWDDTPEYETENLTGIPEAEYIELVDDRNIEVLAHTAREAEPEEVDDDGPNVLAGGGVESGGPPLPDGAMLPALKMPPPLPQMVHDIKIKRKLYNGCLKLAAVPQEEFRIDRNATRLDEEHVRFCAHVDMSRTRSSLIRDYPDKRDVIDELPARTGADTPENTARRRYVEADTAPDASTDLIEVWECYVQLDYDGDGVAEWRRVVTAAGSSEQQILLNEEWSGGLPFTDIVPDPMPHRWNGRSLYDEIGDIQRAKTVFLRGINDNLRWVNNPQRQAPEGGIAQVSLDEFLSPTPGGTVFTVGGAVITSLEVPFIADKLMAGLDLLDRIREFRTGVSAATMSLDPEALQNQTATAVNAAQTASYSKIETYARNIAEIGLKRLFRCILKLIVQNQDQPRMIRLRGKFVEMDPRGWDADMDVVINVGLGSGSRDRDLAMLNAVAAKQELVVSGLGPMIAAQLGLGPDVVFETYRKMVEAAGIKSPETYFPDITRDDVARVMQQQQAAPDPKMAETQAKIQAMQAELQAKVQGEQARMQMEQQSRQQQAALDWQHKQQQSQIDNQNREQELQSKNAAMIAELQMKHQLAVEQAQREFELRQQEIAANAVLKERELQLEAELKMRQMMMQPNVSPNIQEPRQ